MTNDLAPELRRRNRVAWNAFKSGEEVVKRTKILRLRVHLFDSTVLPALTCTSETWALRKQDENAIQVSQRGIKRAITFHSSERRNSEFRSPLVIKNQGCCLICQGVKNYMGQTRNAIWRRPLGESCYQLDSAGCQKNACHPSTTWSDFFIKTLNERFETLVYPGVSRRPWATLAHDWDECRSYWCLLELISEQQDDK